jgi:hypothetical protein
MREFFESAFYLASWGFRILVNVVFGGFGLAFILSDQLSGSRWPFLETHASGISTFLTLVGTFCTAGSIYLYSDSQNKPPEKLSVFVTAPIILTMCSFAMFYLLKNGSLPANTVNGFSLLAIGGALLRAQPNPSEDNKIYWKRKP